MTDAPERIWARPVGASKDWDGVTSGPWSTENVYGISVPYVPEDRWSTDMDAAPKDGTPVLVFATRDGWEGNPRIVCAIWGGLGPRWTIYGSGSTSHSEQWLDTCNPTHWMPLPAPPKGETE